MDDALTNATAARDKLASEINTKVQEVEDLRRRLSRVENFIGQWHEFAGTAPNTSTSAALPVDSGDIRPERPRTTGNPKKEDVAAAARVVIGSLGGPIPRADLFKALAARGVVVRGADPEKTLSTMLWRMRHRVAVVKGGYWLAEVPNPEIGYEPDLPALKLQADMVASNIALANEPPEPSEDQEEEDPDPWPKPG